MIFTSNYARQGTNPLAIAISVKPPDWYKGEHLPALAPTWEIVMGIKNKEITEDEYTTEYINLLEKRNIDPKTILTLPKGTMLLCYESPNDFCHRQVLSSWVFCKTSIWIPEWENEEERKEAERKTFVDSMLGF